MQIVIDIPNWLYNAMLEHKEPIYSQSLAEAVRDGTPLPEHGRLGDLDALYKDVSNGIKAGNYIEGYEDYGHINNMDDCLEAIKYAETVIPATKEGDGK